MTGLSPGRLGLPPPPRRNLVDETRDVGWGSDHGRSPTAFVATVIFIALAIVVIAATFLTAGTSVTIPLAVVLVTGLVTYRAIATTIRSRVRTVKAPRGSPFPMRR